MLHVRTSISLAVLVCGLRIRLALDRSFDKHHTSLALSIPRFVHVRVKNCGSRNLRLLALQNISMHEVTREGIA